jgi:hypothetical protein
LTSNYNFSVIIAGNLNIHGITRVWNVEVAAH